MFRTFLIVFIALVSVAFSVNAQIKTNKILLGKKSVIVKGEKFNEIEYSFSNSRNKHIAYQFQDKKSLIVSEISYEFENSKYRAVKIEVFTCPLVKIDKQNSYNIEMENEAISAKTYWRLTLLSKGSGADNLYFQKQIITAETTETSSVNNITINIINQIRAEKLLKQFTK